MPSPGNSTFSGWVTRTRSLKVAAPSTVADRHRSAPASVGPGDDLQEVAAGVLPVDAATPVVVVDLAGPAAARVGPVGQLPFPDAPEDLVELVLADQESVVLGVHRAAVVGEVEGDV